MLTGGFLLVLTSSQAAIYPTPSNENPMITEPVFRAALPSCASLSIGQSSTSSSGINSTAIYGVTHEGFVIRYDLTSQPIRGSANATNTECSGMSFHLRGGSHESFPYPTEGLAVTEVVGGSKKAVWVHWRRGADGWPIHLLGSSDEALPVDLSGMDLSPSRPARTISMFRALDSTAPTEGGVVSSADIFNHIRQCTRDYVSMPRVCFDEGIGRLIISGMSMTKIAVIEYA